VNSNVMVTGYQSRIPFLEQRGKKISASGKIVKFARVSVLEIHEREGAVVFAVRVQPRASKNEVAGVMEGALKIRLQAPAVEGRANEGLREFLAELLKRPKSTVRILSGERSRVKRVEIAGVTAAEVESLIRVEA